MRSLTDAMSLGRSDRNQSWRLFGADAISRRRAWIGPSSSQDRWRSRLSILAQPL